MSHKASAAVSLSEARAAQKAASEQQQADRVAQGSPLYGVAMLKIAMELKKPGAPELEAILTGVLERMRIDERQFREYLMANGGLLRTIAQRKKF